MVIALAPILAVMVVGAVQTATVVPIAVGTAKAVLERFVAATAPTAVVSIVAVEGKKLAQRELCDHCEYAARCTTLQGSPTR